MEAWASSVVQWLRLRASLQWTWVQSLVEEVRPPHATQLGKKKKRQKSITLAHYLLNPAQKMSRYQNSADTTQFYVNSTTKTLK